MLLRAISWQNELANIQRNQTNERANFVTNSSRMFPNLKLLKTQVLLLLFIHFQLFIYSFIFLVNVPIFAFIIIILTYQISHLNKCDS